MLIRVLEQCEAALLSLWSAPGSRRAVWLRGITAIAVFLLICGALSPEERSRAESMARDLDRPVPDQSMAAKFYTIPESDFGMTLKEVDGNGNEADAGRYPPFPRIAVVGSSESENWYRVDYPSEYPNLSAAISARLSQRYDERLPVIRAYTPWRHQILRVQKLVHISRSQADVDVVVLSLPIHGFAGQGVRLRDTNDTRSATVLLKNAYTNGPASQVDRRLASLFPAYEGRFQYSLAPYVPGASEPVIIRFQGGETNDDASTGLAIDNVAAPARVEDVPRQIAQIVRENARAANVEQLMEHVNRCSDEFDVRILLVLMPLGTHLFSETDRKDIDAYGETLAAQIRDTIESDTVRLLDLRNSGIVAPDQFRDPVHILDFGSVSDAIMEDLQEAAWLTSGV